MTIARIKDPPFGVGAKLTSGEISDIDGNVTNALDKRAGQTEIHACTGEGLKRCAADPGRHASELPATGNCAQHRILLDIGKQPAVPDVDDVSAIVAKDAICGIPDITWRLSRRTLAAAADAKGL